MYNYIKLRDQEDINLTFMGGLFHPFIRGNDLNKTMHKDNTQMQGTFHYNQILINTTLYYFRGITPQTSITWFELGF